MIDTHCHINADDFINDISEVIENAKNAGLTKLIVIGFDPKTNQKALDLANQYDFIYATAGIHPNDVNVHNNDGLEAFYQHKKIVAVGECGLDFYYQDENRLKQIEIFVEQIELSIKHNLPLVIHTRNSFKETYECLLPYKGKAKGVFHCFSSDLEDAKKAVELGFYIGIDGPVTFKNAKDIKDIAAIIPLDKILIETDSPYLSPDPFRGKRNEPKRLPLIAKAIAEIRGLDIEDVIKQTTINANNLFCLGDE